MTNLNVIDEKLFSSLFQVKEKLTQATKNTDSKPN